MAVNYPKQYIKVPQSWEITDDDKVAVVWEDRLIENPQALQQATKEIGEFRRETEGRKIANATEVIQTITGMQSKKPNSTNSPHVNEVSTSFTKK